jgi:hypothetical protein
MVNRFAGGSAVADAFFLLLLVGFGAATWGLVVLCDRLMGSGQ